MSASSANPLSLEPLHGAPPFGIWEDAALLSLWQDNEYGVPRPAADLPTPAGSVHSPQQREQRTPPTVDSEVHTCATMDLYRPLVALKRKSSTDSCLARGAKRLRTNSEPCLPISSQSIQNALPDSTTPQSNIATSTMSHAHPKQQLDRSIDCTITSIKPIETVRDMPQGYPLPCVLSTVTPPPERSGHGVEIAPPEADIGPPSDSDSFLAGATTPSSVTPPSDPQPTKPLIYERLDISPNPSQIYKDPFSKQCSDQIQALPAGIRSVPTPDTLPICGAETLSDEMDLTPTPSSQHGNDSGINNDRELTTPQLPPYPVSVEDEKFIKHVKVALRAQSKWKSVNVGRRQAGRILELLEIAQPPTPSEALIVSVDEAAKHFECGQFFLGPVITSDAQPLPLQTTEQFLDEFYDDTAKVWIQDPGVRLVRNIPHAREITIGQLKQRFPNRRTNMPWNCLEMATHVEDGLRPTFLNSEDCRLLTKLKIPGSGDSASRRGYDPGWKEVEKWALLAQGGALTEPHQDSHGYSTYITMNQGTAGFGWLSNPTAEERLAWRRDPATYTGGRWRYAVLRPGQTVFFPSGTVHFVFRLKALGDTLAFGGHVLLCSQIVRWVEAMLEEKAGADITNEDLTVSAPAYLGRVEKFVKQAMARGKEARWGGREAVERFLQLKKEFDGPQK